MAQLDLLVTMIHRYDAPCQELAQGGDGVVITGPGRHEAPRAGLEGAGDLATLAGHEVSSWQVSAAPGRCPVNPGTIVLLNGASSSGKSTIARALQETMPGPVLQAGLDRFLWMLPARYLERPLWDDVLGLASSAGGTGRRLIAGMHRALRALALAGCDVVADHVLVEPAWLADCAHVLADLPAYLVAVRCPLDVLEARERARADRTLGQARAQFDRVHAGAVYDLELDTALLEPREAAELVMARLAMGPPHALRQLRQRLPAPV